MHVGDGAWRDRTVVVTGASSGVGREAAIEFARRGATVVLAARRRDALEATARRCRAVCGEAMVMVTDVSREEEVTRLVDAVVAASEHIDVWVNNAGVTLFARLEDAPFEEHRRVIETNLFGPIFAARAVIPVFRRQRRGVMINVGSVLSQIGQPYVPSYVISKFGLRGMSEALRTELADEPDVHVCSILPYAIDTPHFQSGANVMGFEAHAMPPVQSPEKIGRAIVDLAERPRRQLVVPRIAVLGLMLHWLLPRATERMILGILQRWHFAPDVQAPTTGNLYAGGDDAGAAHGTRPPQIGFVGLLGWLAGNAMQVLWPSEGNEAEPRPS